MRCHNSQRMLKADEILNLQNVFQMEKHVFNITVMENKKTIIIDRNCILTFWKHAVRNKDQVVLHKMCLELRLVHWS